MKIISDPNLYRAVAEDVGDGLPGHGEDAGAGEGAAVGVGDAGEGGVEAGAAEHDAVQRLLRHHGRGGVLGPGHHVRVHVANWSEGQLEPTIN